MTDVKTAGLVKAAPSTAAGEEEADVSPAGTQSLTDLAFRRLVNAPDFLYEVSHLPPDLAFAQPSEGLIAGLKPQERVRLATVHPGVRAGLLGPRPPLPRDLEAGSELGDHLAIAVDVLPSLHVAQAAIEGERAGGGVREGSDGASRLGVLEREVAERLVVWAPLARQWASSLEDLASVAEPETVAAVLAHDTTLRRAFIKQMTLEVGVESTAAAQRACVLSTAKAIEAALKRLEPLWSTTTPSAAARNAVAALGFLTETLAKHAIHTYTPTPSELAREGLPEDSPARLETIFGVGRVPDALVRLVTQRMEVERADPSQRSTLICDYLRNMDHGSAEIIARLGAGGILRPEVVDAAQALMRDAFPISSVIIERITSELQNAHHLRRACRAHDLAAQACAQTVDPRGSASESGRGRDLLERAETLVQCAQTTLQLAQITHGKLIQRQTKVIRVHHDLQMELLRPRRGRPVPE